VREKKGGIRVFFLYIKILANNTHFFTLID
jgi:hypothetical protein